MIKISNPSQCSGCTACSSVCGHHAITMTPDSLGFKYPVVDEAKCVECGLCEKICPFHDGYSTPLNLSEPEAYGARLLNEQQLCHSQSGGMFSAISDLILEKGGVIYGAGYGASFRVMHKSAETKAERDSFRGSKYVQSDLSDVFLRIRADLLKGKLVMFTGTPCQCAGLDAFIPSRLRANLLIVDIICHGVPSPAIWADYTKSLEKRFNSKLVRTNFRDKQKYGWRLPRETYSFANGKELTATGFLSIFYKSVCLRESCFDCKFSNLRRPSDITIGDFWGCEKVNPELANDKKGVSLVLCNTDKGATIFADIKPRLLYFPITLTQALQPNLQSPTDRPVDRTQFEIDYAQKGYRYIMKKYGEDGLKFRLKRQCLRVLSAPRVLCKRLLKKNK